MPKILSTTAQQEQVRKDLSTSPMILVKLFPDLPRVLGMTAPSDDSTPGTCRSHPRASSSLDSSNHSANGGVENVDDAKNRFLFAITVLMRASCRSIQGQPLVMVLDDMQWADAPSIDLLETLSQDSQLGGLVLVCSYRSNEIADSHLMSKWIQTSLESTTMDHDCVAVTQLVLDNLGIEAVGDEISNVLNLTQEEVHDLAVIVYRKTMGNAFFVIEFLKHLAETKLLVFHLGLVRWTWDIGQLDAETETTDNVVDMM